MRMKTDRLLAVSDSIFLNPCTDYVPSWCNVSIDRTIVGSVPIRYGLT